MCCKVSVTGNEKRKDMWSFSGTLGNSFGIVILWMTGNDDAELKGVGEFKWERKRGLSWDKMSKGAGFGQIKYVLVSLCAK